jgi:hypothetical protein
VKRVLLLSSMLLFASSVLAQLSTATLKGRVTDPTNAVLVDAKIDAVNIGTNVRYSRATDSSGNYTIPSLPPGDYQLEVKMPGFKSLVQPNVVLHVQEALELNFQLQLGSVTENVRVELELSRVETVDSTMKMTVDRTQMSELPLNGRNYEQLIALAPGVTPDEARPHTAISGNGNGYSIAGSRPHGQAFLLDGVSMAGFLGNTSGSNNLGTSLGVDAIAEFATLTNTFGAQYGGNGAVINAITRSGTNAIHGSAFEFYRNSAMDARGYFDPLSGPPPLTRNQFGGTLGGPIRRDKAFFFVDYEGLRQTLTTSGTGIVPDSNARNGFLPCKNVTPAPNPCPASGLANVGVNSAIQPYLPIFPAPNGQNFGNGTAQFLGLTTQTLTENYFAGRVDYNLSSRDAFFARYLLDDSNYANPSNVLGVYSVGAQERNQLFTMQETRTISATKLNQFRFSFFRNRPLFSNNGTPPGPLQFVSGLPGQLSVGGLTSISPSPFSPGHEIQSNFTESDQFLWNKGRHSLTIGGEIRRVQANAGITISTGAYTFNTLQTFLQGQAFTYVGPTGVNDPGRSVRQTELKGFVQDDFKVNSRLTVNAGLRYEFVTNPVEKNGKMNFLIDPVNDRGFTHVDHFFAKNPSLFNLDPRVGFAWNVFGNQKTSVRGGFGVFHDVLAPWVYIWSTLFNPPTQVGLRLFPPFPNPLAGGTLTPPAPTFNFQDDYRNFQTAYMQQYNLNVQQQLGSWLFMVGYVGSRSFHLSGNSYPNVVAPQICPCTNPTSPFAAAIAALPAGTQYRPSAGEPRIIPAFGNFTMNNSAYNSHYDSLQLSLDKQTSRGLQMHSAYTFSKNIDNMSQLGGIEILDSVQWDLANRRLDYGRSAFDIRHNWLTTMVYVLPFKGNALLSGWQLSGIAQLHSGRPFSPVIGFDNANLGGEPNQRPNLKPGANPGPVLGSPNQWFDPSSFSLPIPGVIGNASRNTITEPGLAKVDAAVSKDTKISERAKVQFRAEFFNILNHTNFGRPTNTVFTDASGNPSPTAGRIFTTSTTPRNIQLAVKFTF